MRKELLLSGEEEKQQYLTHLNDVKDSRYQNFVRPIVDAVTAHFGPQHKGLDFGAGTGPVISWLLAQRGYEIVQYDPFFYPFPETLQREYDYIVACEVVEHFYHPEREFALLRNLLRKGGMLFIMTLLYDDSIAFSRWFYKNEDTHVFFYQAETFQWIQMRFAFSDLKIEKRLIRLRG
jgi:2-polyprenyl-3-methyl-5-hydroxy-6-metoxy-1,4-benzoquinol methylase